MQVLREWLAKEKFRSFARSNRFVWFVVCGVLLWYFSPLLLGKSIGIGDNFSLMVPGKIFTAHWLAQGIVPLWNPYLLGGISWVGDINQSVLYPSSLFFMLFDGGVALNLTIVSHVLIAASGMIVLLRYYKYVVWQQILGTLLWVFSPQLVVTLNNISTLQSLAWMPWVVWAGVQVGERRFAPLLFILFVFLQLWGGYPQYVLYAVFLAVILCAARILSVTQYAAGKPLFAQVKKFFASWFVIGLATIFVTAVLWIPFLETLRDSTRSQQTTAQASTGSLSVLELHRFLQPYVFEHHLSGITWGAAWNDELVVTPFFGLFGLGILILWFRKKQKLLREKFFAAVLLTTVLFAFGDAVPGFAELQHGLPVLSAARGSSSVFILTSIVWAIWLPQLLTQLTLQKRAAKTVSLVLVCTATALFVLVAISMSHFSQIWHLADTMLSGKLSQSLFHTPERDQLILQLVAWFTAILFTTTAATAWFWHKRQYWLLTIVIVLELMTFSRMYFFFVPSTLYDVPSRQETAAKLLPENQDYRVLIRNYNVPYTDVAAYRDALIKRVPFTDSYVTATELQTFSHAKELQLSLTPGWNQVYGVASITGYTTLVPLDMTSVFTEPLASGRPYGSQATEGPGINRLAEISPSDPALERWATRYYLVDTWYPLYGEVPAGELVAETGDWQLYELPGTSSRFRFADDSSPNISSVAETPNQLSFTVISEYEQELLVADRWSRHWTATIDDEEVPVENVGGQRMIHIPAGTHYVAFSFQFWSGLFE